MSTPADSTLFDTLTPVQTDVLKALAEGASVTAAARQGGVHRGTVHLWTRDHPTFARALFTARQDRAERVADELGALADLALDTFRHLLSDEKAPASVRLKAALEIVKLVQNQRPTELAQLKSELRDDAVFRDLHLATVATGVNRNPPPKRPEPVRNAPCPCGSRLKYKRCCGNPVGLAPGARAA